MNTQSLTILYSILYYAQFPLIKSLLFIFTILHGLLNLTALIFQLPWAMCSFPQTYPRNILQEHRGQGQGHSSESPLTALTSLMMVTMSLFHCSGPLLFFCQKNCCLMQHQQQGCLSLPQVQNLISQEPLKKK